VSVVLALAFIWVAGDRPTSALASARHSGPVGGTDRGPEVASGRVAANGDNGYGSPGISGRENDIDDEEANGGVLTSVNWAGYIDTGPTFSSVAGSWVEPTATCPQNQVQQAAFWVGIGGFVQSDPDIEQIGTDSDCLKAKGHKAAGPNYYAWYQMYPQSLVVLPTSSYPVSPGQTISASVTVTGANQYTLTVTNGHWKFSTVQSQASQPADASGEWITEAPSSCNSRGKCKTLPLADFDSLATTSESANGEPISGSGLTDSQVNMTTKNGKTVKAETSSLGSGGSSFSVTWEHN
jgi:hypothetical protein